MGVCNSASKSAKASGSGSANSAGGGGDGLSDNDIAKQLSEDAPTRLAKADVPALEGTPSEISTATQIRNEYGRSLQRYALTRGSDGRPIGAEYSQDMLRGDTQARVKAVKDYAERNSFGNSEIYPEKLQQAISMQKDLNQRYTRYKKLITEHKSAKWWIKNNGSGFNFFNEYIDGKVDKPGEPQDIDKVLRQLGRYNR